MSRWASAGSLLIAVLTLIIAHAGGSACWTASSTLLQKQTDDRFRGRVFSAEFAFSMLMLSVSSFAAGQAVDRGIDVRTVAIATGRSMLVPVVRVADRGPRVARMIIPSCVSGFTSPHELLSHLALFVTFIFIAWPFASHADIDHRVHMRGVRRFDLHRAGTLLSCRRIPI